MSKLLARLKGPRDRTVYSGIVERVTFVFYRDNIDGICKEHLSLVTLRPLDSNEDAIILIYAKLECPERYIGRCVDVVTKRTGWFGSTFNQQVTSADSSLDISITRPYSIVKWINKGLSYQALFEEVSRIHKPHRSVRHDQYQ